MNDEQLKKFWDQILIDEKERFHAHKGKDDLIPIFQIGKFDELGNPYDIVVIAAPFTNDKEKYAMVNVVKDKCRKGNYDYALFSVESWLLKLPSDDRTMEQARKDELGDIGKVKAHPKRVEVFTTCLEIRNGFKKMATAEIVNHNSPFGGRRFLKNWSDGMEVSAIFGGSMFNG